MQNFVRRSMAVFLFLNGIFPNVGFLSMKVCGKIPQACFCLGVAWKNSEGCFLSGEVSEKFRSKQEMSGDV